MDLRICPEKNPIQPNVIRLFLLLKIRWRCSLFCFPPSKNILGQELRLFSRFSLWWHKPRGNFNLATAWPAILPERERMRESRFCWLVTKVRCKPNTSQCWIVNGQRRRSSWGRQFRLDFLLAPIWLLIQAHEREPKMGPLMWIWAHNLDYRIIEVNVRWLIPRLRWVVTYA